MPDTPPPLRTDAAALFLDVDGTLIDLAPTPEAVRVPEGLPATLIRLDAALGGALALVSGRPIGQIDRLFAPFAPRAAGLHGFERRAEPGGAVERAAESEALGPARAALKAFADGREGVLLEDKGYTLALHYRAAPGRADEAARVAERAVEDSSGGLVLLRGKMVLELKPPGVDKGRAVEAFMAAAPFAGRRPVFCGDDVTDEAGFRAVNAQGGLSVRVGDDGRSTEATTGVPDVAAFRAWLEALAAA